MKLHDVKVYPSKVPLKREDQLAWKIAGVAADKVAVEKPVTEMIINRIIDNAAVAVASVNRHSVTSARGMALGHPRSGRLRNEVTRNPWLWAALALCTVLVTVPPYVPPLAHVLQLTPPSAAMWAIVLGMSLAPLIVTQAVVEVLTRWRTKA